MRSRSSALLSIAMLVALPLVAGCAGEATGENVASGEEELANACTAERYDAALAHYKNAVAWSKARFAERCGSEHDRWAIADEASAAVTTCGAFRETIRTSPWAEPIRATLATSLTLPSLTGELLVIKDSPWQNWSGTEALLSRGVEFATHDGGVFGPTVIVALGASGKGTWRELVEDGETMTRLDTPATYTVEKIDGTAKGKRRVRITHGGATDVFILGVKDGATYAAAPLFTLTGPSRTFFSLQSECDI